MYILENGKNKVIVSDKKRVSVNYTLNLDELEDSVFVNLPGFNISFYVENEDQVAKQAKISLNSFFGYWLIKMGRDEFFRHMLELGFTIKSRGAKGVKRVTVLRRKKSLRVIHDSDQYSF